MVGHVLVVVDDAAKREIYTNDVELMELSFTTATNGIEALADVKKQISDSILLDLIMPEMDNRQVIAHLQDDDTTRQIPVMVISGHNNARDTQILAGVSRVMQKGPFSLDYMQEAVREALDGRL